MSAETYIGGDTGTSHFAWALDKSPKNLIYYSSSRGLVHTLPFYALEGKGKIKSYWLDFEGGWTPTPSKIQ
jgi:ADP-heptose:LPS heptosyltransferase